MKVYWSPEYNAAQATLETFRKSLWIAKSLQSNPIAGVEIVAPTPLTGLELAQTHDPFYVGKVRQDKALWASVAASNGGMLQAARTALTEGVAGTLSSGLHHAQRGREKGFCTFNGLAHTALTLLREGTVQNVLILDLDAHCGGGTHSFFKSNPKVCCVDLSTDEFDQYLPAQWNVLKIVEPALYLSNVLTTLQGLKTQHVDLVLYNAGMDPIHNGVSSYTLRKREKLVFEWCKDRGLPVAFTMAGGYLWDCPHLGRKLTREELVNLHRITIEAACM